MKPTMPRSDRVGIAPRSGEPYRSGEENGVARAARYRARGRCINIVTHDPQVHAAMDEAKRQGLPLNKLVEGAIHKAGGTKPVHAPPPNYWQTLESLQDAELRHLRANASGDAAGVSRYNQLRQALRAELRALWADEEAAHAKT